MLTLVFTCFICITIVSPVLAGNTKDNTTEIQLSTFCGSVTNVYSDSITYAGEVDWFKFTVPYSGNFQVHINTSTYLKTFLYKDDGTQLDYKYNGWNVWNIYLGDHFYLQPGDYYISVQAWDNTYYGSYTIRVNGTNMPTEILLSTFDDSIINIYSDSITSFGEINWFKFTVQHTGNYQARIATSTYLRAFLYKEDGTQLDYSYNNTGVWNIYLGSNLVFKCMVRKM